MERITMSSYYQNIFKRILYFGIYAADILPSEGAPAYDESVRRRLEEAGRKFLEKADALHELGQEESAAEYYRKATDHLHFAQFFMVGGHRGALQTALRGAFARYLEYSAPQGYYSIDEKYKGHALRGFGVTDPRHQSCMIFIGGLDSSKEVELYYFSREFFKRGFNVICVDFPGQGELANEGCFSEDFDAFFSGVYAWARGRSPTPRHVGVFGVSLGGHYSLRAAHLEPGLAFAISLGGFIDHDPFNKLRAEMRPTLHRAVFGRENCSEDDLNSIGLKRLGPYVGAPVLYVNGSQDYLVDEEQLSSLREHFHSAEFILLEGAEHVGTSRFSHVLPYIADWAQRRCTGEDVQALKQAYKLN